MATFPVLSGLLLGGWSAGGAAVAVLVGTAFLAHEAVHVLLGGRGARVRTTLGPRARASLVPLAVVATAAAVALVGTGAPGVLGYAAVPGVLGLAVLGLTVAGTVKSLPGELLVAAAFASVHLAVAASGGAGGGSLWIPALVWFLAFALATLTVHSLKLRFKGRGPGGWAVPAARVLGVGVLAVGMVGPALRPDLPGLAALVPVAVVPLGISVRLVHPRHLRRIGWTLVGTDALALVLLGVLGAG